MVRYGQMARAGGKDPPILPVTPPMSKGMAWVVHPTHTIGLIDARVARR